MSHIDPQHESDNEYPGDIETVEETLEEEEETDSEDINKNQPIYAEIDEARESALRDTYVEIPEPFAENIINAIHGM